MITKKGLEKARRIISGMERELSYWRKLESKIQGRLDRVKRKKREALAEEFKAGGYIVDERPYRIDYFIEEYMEGGVCKFGDVIEVKHFFRVYTILGETTIMVNYINEATHEDIMQKKELQIKRCLDAWVDSIVLWGEYDWEAGIRED